MQKLKNLLHLCVSWFYTIVYGFPIKKLKVIFVTGTDGKTTTSFMLYKTLNSAGFKTGLISTIEARAGDKALDTGLHTTTPANGQLQKILKELVAAKCEYVVFEITSHGIDQHRVVGANPIAGVITNITPEHLDYFGTVDNVVKTKSKVLLWAKRGFVNKYDPSLQKILNFITDKTEVDIYDRESVRPNLADAWKQKFPGDYNLENAAATYSVCKYLGLEDAQIYVGLGTVQPPTGRFDAISNSKGLNLYVDFAHTPNALKNMLIAMKQKHPEGNLIVVFGSAGERDKYKRPLMGEFAQQEADLVVITAEDPRSEKVEDISAAIAVGAKKAGGIEDKTYFFKYDRQEAIDFAVNQLAHAGDTIVVTGKGHEQSMNFGQGEIPWSDHEAMKRVLSSQA